MRKALYTVLLAGLFAVMLSALVVSPEAPAEQPAARVHQDFHALFRPMVSAILPDAVDCPSGRAEVRVIFCALPLLFQCCIPFSVSRDANGRILTSVRYENSVYQLFRAEVAGG